MALLFREFFTDTDGVALESHAPDAGNAWVQTNLGGPTGSIVINGNTGKVATTTKFFYRSRVSLQASQYAQVLVSAQLRLDLASANEFLALLARVTDVAHDPAPNYLKAYGAGLAQDSGGGRYFRVWKWDSADIVSGPTTLHSQVLSGGEGDAAFVNVRMQLEGSALTVWFNDVSTPVVRLTDSTIASGAAPGGIAAKLSTTARVALVENYAATDVEIPHLLDDDEHESSFVDDPLDPRQARLRRRIKK